MLFSSIPIFCAPVCHDEVIFELVRAKEILSHHRWRAEREFPSQWGGHKLNINVVGKVELFEALGVVAGELLDQIAIEGKQY